MGIFLRKYGVEATIDFSLYEADGLSFRTDAVHASGDSVIMKDEGAEANTTNGFTDEGTGYSIVLTATEMQAARVKVYFVDQTGPNVWLDKSITIETYGNASAQHAIDLDDSVRAGLTALPNAAADAAGGLPISDAGGLDIDTQLAETNEITSARMGALTDWINGGRLDLLIDAVKERTDNLPDDPSDASVITAQFAVIEALLDPEIADIITHLTEIKGATFDSNTDSLEDIKDLLSTVTGAGAIEWQYTLTDSGSGLPIADADVWITSDASGVNILASLKTDANGQATFYLDAGTVYVWRQKTGYNFINPDIETVV